MSSFQEAYERIKFATTTKTQVEIAEILEIRQSSISDAKRRNSVPAEWVMKLFDKFGLNPDWIKQGIGPMYLRTEAGYHPQEGPSMGLADNAVLYGEPSAKSVMITVYGMACPDALEKGASALPSVGKISLPLSFAETDIQVLRMDAPNMEPFIVRNAYLGVDCSVKVPVSGMVYALYWPHEGVVIRRVYLDSDEMHYILRSDASQHPEVRLPVATLHQRLMGKVTWVLQNI